jgi:sugar-specific transcriptional regulator TrmB
MTSVNKMLIDKLRLAGLNEKEARFYLASLELGPTGMWDIHRKSGLKRPTCYLVFEGLAERGIGIKTKGRKKTLYSVIEPATLANSLEYKKEQFNRSLALFDAVLSISKEKPEISLYSGLEGMRQAYLLGINQPAGSELLLYGDTRIWSQYEEQNEQYIKDRVGKRISLKVLFSDDNKSVARFKSDELEIRESRFLPRDEFKPLVEQQIINDYVIYIAYSEKEPFATVIKNQTIAQLERQKFYLLWQKASKS